MRIEGTKYDDIDLLPGNAMPVSIYAKKYKVRSPAYVYVKFDLFKFGYKKKDGSMAYGEDPGYEIRAHHGICYVIRQN